MDYFLGMALGTFSGFCAGYAVAASRPVQLVRYPSGSAPPPGHYPVRVVETDYGPPPRVAHIGVAHDPEPGPIYAYRLHESCRWYAATRGRVLPDGSLEATSVFVAGHWEETVTVARGKWCVVDRYVRDQP